MARARNIKPGFFLNEELAEIEPLGRILFEGLWCLADRRGRLQDRPKRIKAEVLPYDDCDVDALVGALCDKGFLIRYDSGCTNYIQIVNFEKHQNPHKNEAESTIPPPEEYERAPEQHHASTVQAPDKHSTNRADSLILIPDSLIPDSLSSPNGLSGHDEKPKPEKPKRKRNPTWDALAAVCGEPSGAMKSETKDFGLTVSELTEARASPDDIARFALWWDRTFPDAQLTHRCYRNHWGKFINAPPPRPMQPADIKNSLTRAALTAPLEGFDDQRNDIPPSHGRIIGLPAQRRQLRSGE